MIEYIQHLTKNTLDTDTLDQIRQKVITKTYKSKEIIVQTDILSKNLYFVENGLARVFYSTEDKDVTFYFMKEKDFYVSVESVYQNLTSKCGIEAIGETAVSQINFDFVNQILGNNVQFASMKETLNSSRLYFLKLFHSNYNES